MADTAGQAWSLDLRSSQDWEFDTGPFGGIAGMGELQPDVRSSLMLGPELLNIRRFSGTFQHASATPILLWSTDPAAAVFWRGPNPFSHASSTPAEAELGLPRQAAYWLGTGYTILEILRSNRSQAWARFLARLSTLAAKETPIAPPSIYESVAEHSSEAARVSEALSQICEWLDVSIEDIAGSTGIALRTLRYWRTHSVNPRPRTVRPIWRLHAFATALHRSLGSGALRDWLHEGQPSPQELILAGQLSIVEERARGLLYQDAQSTRQFSGFSESDGDEPSRRGEGQTFRRSARKPARAGLRER